jgi:site-specific DNA-cytosine methylase
MPDKDNFGAVLTPFPAGSIGGYTEGDAAGTIRAAGGGSENLAVCGALCHRITNTSVQEAAAGHLIAVPFRKSKRAQSTTDDESWVQAEQANTMNAFDTGEPDTHAVAFSPGNLKRGAGAGPNEEVFPTLKCSAGRGADDQRPCVAIGTGERDTHPVAFHPTQDPISSSDGSTHCIGTRSSGGAATVAIAFKVGNSAAARSDGVSVECSPTLTSGSGGNTKPGIAHRMTVRRLTPRECERLQGFPDDWTLIPWRGKPAEDCPDGNRYKALGNSMAVNCMEWIGERIAAYEEARP